MDADDEAMPYRLERQVTVLDSHPELAVLGSGMEAIDEAGRVTGTCGADIDPAAIRR